MAEEGRVAVDKGVIFGTGGGRELRGDVYTPPGPVSGAPGVLLVHGGGWREGDRTQLQGYGILLGRQGFVCLACEYRLLPESPWPAQIEDVKAAIRWMRANAAGLGIDPGRIAIHGNSAGAHLALMAAGTPNRPDYEGEGGNPGVGTDVAAVVAIYPPTAFFHTGPKRGATPLAALSDLGSEDFAAEVSPLNYATAAFPPTLLIHGTGDEVVPWRASLQMFEALTAVGVPVELHLYAGQPHAFDAQPSFGRQCAADARLFLDRYARTPDPLAR